MLLSKQTKLPVFVQLHPLVKNVGYLKKVTKVRPPKGRGKISDLCKYWGIAPNCSYTIVTHAKAQSILWFRTLDVSLSTQWNN